MIEQSNAEDSAPTVQPTLARSPWRATTSPISCPTPPGKSPSDVPTASPQPCLPTSPTGLEFAAFLSYARADDQHEGGLISQLCERLSAEVRIQIGQDFPIFQDRKDITWGQNWQARIDETIDTVTLLIPVMTPRFFGSVACREEVSRFLERERLSGRSDLIMPVYYVNAPQLDNSAMREDNYLARILFGRQYADWRELRFEPFTATVVRRSLAEFASQICETLWRPTPRSGQREQVEDRLERVPRDAMKPTPIDVQMPSHRHVERFDGTHGAQVEATLPQEVRHRAGPTAPAPSERLLTPREVAALFAVDPKTVTRWASAGRINSIQTPGGHRRFRETEVHAVLASLTFLGSPDRTNTCVSASDPAWPG